MLKRYKYFLVILFLYSKLHAVEIEIKSDSVCLNDTSVLFVNTSIPASDITIIEWDLDNNGFYNDAKGHTIKYKYSFAGFHEIGVQLTTTEGKVYFSDSKSYAVVYPNPVSDFVVRIPCAGKQTIFSVDSSRFDAYWNFGQDNGFNSYGNTVPHIFSGRGDYNISLKLISKDKCQSIVNKTITIFDLPQMQFTSENIGCNKFRFKGTEGDYNLIWQFGDNSLDFSTEPIEHTYEKPGIYNVVQYLLTKEGCRDTLFNKVFLPPAPIVNITYANDSILKADEAITLVATVSNTGADLLWNNGSNTGTIEVSSPGEYYVVASNASGCNDTAFINLVEEKKPADKPGKNVDFLFTPNNDGNNDLFIIPGYEEPLNCSLKVFSINGNIIYISDNYKNDWNGEIKGKTIPSGVYYFVLNNESGILTKGSINVLK